MTPRETNEEKSAAGARLADGLAQTLAALENMARAHEKSGDFWCAFACMEAVRQLQQLTSAVRYLAGECDPKRNGFLEEFPALRDLANPAPPQ